MTPRQRITTHNSKGLSLCGNLNPLENLDDLSEGTSSCGEDLMFLKTGALNNYRARNKKFITFSSHLLAKHR